MTATTSSPDKARPHFDIAVIGAGVNGAGIARDAALRGLKTVVIEQNDVCSGTSAWSSRLIHGGLRYLEYAEIPLVYESLRERRTLRVIAPHLVKPLRISIPVYAGAKRAPWLIRLGMLCYDLLSFTKKMPRHQMLSASAFLGEEPGVRPDGLKAAARYYDAQVTFAERLVLENLLAAAAADAEIRLYEKVTSISVANGLAGTIETVDELTGDKRELSASVIVNAAGPWVDSVLDASTAEMPRLIGGTKGSHVIVGHFDGAPKDAFYIEAETDGRPFFVIPWNGLYLIGTTDIRYDGSPGDVRASREEMDYLITETNRVFPAAELTVDDVHYAYAGVRPLPHKDKGPESAITRKHIIRVHKETARNLVSIVGGKLTTYRHLAEEAVDKSAKILGRRVPKTRTADTPLPGGWGLDAARDALRGIPALSAEGVERLLSIYGGRARDIAAIASEEWPKALDDRGRVLEAEVVFVIRREFARTLADVVHRRTMIGLSADQGRPLYARLAEVAAAEAGWDDSRRAEELSALERYSDSFLAG